MASSSPLHSEWSEDRPFEDNLRPLSGPGTSRHTRRLQLRNAKFQGSSVPTRKVTPQSQTSSSNWSVTGEVQCSSDMENRSPGGTEASSFKANTRESSGALQEISNTSLPRPKKSKSRVSLGKLFGEDAGSYDSTSPEGQRSSLLPRAVRLRAKPGHARQSLNTETKKYIEHLENELSVTQQQLSVATSPSVTREQSSRMRNLNSETKQLHDELADWEAKYEQRVEEAVDSHRENEARLRARVRLLEQEAEEAKARAQDLSGQLVNSNQTLEAVETANVNLEKRLEIMSGIMAAAPNKIDLHVEIPGRTRTARPRSMLPRFPTAGTLITSPERQQSGHASSPSVSHAPHSAGIFDPSVQGPMSPAGFSSDAESYFSESSAGPAGVENAWGLPQPSSAKTKPMRRMRKFGAGSFGPKPLILPSTSSHEQIPMSAPLLGRNDMETESIAARIFESPTLNVPSPSTEDDVDETLLCTQSPRAASVNSGPEFSSLGPAAGRNLMDELAAIQTSDMTTSVGMLSVHSEMHSFVLQSGDAGEQSHRLLEYPPQVGHSSFVDAEADPSTPDMQILSTSALVVGSHDWHLLHHHGLSRSTSGQSRIHDIPSGSAFERLHHLFREFWRNPVIIARHLVRTAQSRMRLPNPLLNIQWWLVGVLLGPMARRRMLGDSANPGAHHDVESDTLAYGTMYKTPPGSPDSAVLEPSTRSSSLVAGKGKKRAASREPERHVGFKHSPWLWLKFSITLAFAVGVAFKDGPASLLYQQSCATGRRRSGNSRRPKRDSMWVLTP